MKPMRTRVNAESIEGMCTNSMADLLDWINRNYNAEIARVISNATRAVSKQSDIAGIRTIENVQKNIVSLCDKIPGVSDATRTAYRSRVSRAIVEYTGRVYKAKRQKADSGNNFRGVSISGGEIFTFSDCQHMTIDDAKKIYFHLLTMCSDFDPNAFVAAIKETCTTKKAHFNIGNEDCTRENMDSDKCHAYNNGKCMSGFVCATDAESEGDE